MITRIWINCVSDIDLQDFSMFDCRRTKNGGLIARFLALLLIAMSSLRNALSTRPYKEQAQQ